VSIDDDEDLRAQFEALREHDAQHGPDFRVLWDRAALDSHASARRRAAQLWIVASAAACVVLAVTLVGRGPRVGEVVPPDVRSAPTITDWRSPTAALLQTPGRQLLSPPRILSSVLDGATRAALQRKGE
jgi:hypothetical protein